MGACGHEWDIEVRYIVSGTKCPICSSRRILKGFNDIWTTNPHLASLLLNQDDGYRFTHMSNQRVDWRCPNCQLPIKNKKISDINVYGLSCPLCSDSISYPEKFMYCLLKELNVEFEIEKTFKWSNGRIYDFVILHNSGIIETHGRQHYEQTGREGARTLKEEQENDKYKYEMAMKNGIKEYIVIDCRVSDFEFIKNNILKSRLVEIYELSKVDWDKIHKSITKPIIQNIVDLWNKKLPIKSIAKELSLTLTIVRNNLKRAAKEGVCDYNPRESRIRALAENSKRIVKMDINCNYLHTYENLTDAYKDVGLTNSSRLSVCCASTNQMAAGFRWLYEDDYYNYLRGEIIMEVIEDKNLLKIQQLDKFNNIIRVWESLDVVSKELNLRKPSIARVCNGVRETYAGYKWNYIS